LLQSVKISTSSLFPSNFSFFKPTFKVSFGK
jgi:hypothetical protein